MKLTRFLPLIIPLLVLALNEVYFFYPKLIYLATVLAVLLIFFATWQLSRRSEVDKSWWNYLILPSVLCASLMAYSVFISDKLIIQFLFIFNLVFLYLYLRYVYYYLLNPAAYSAFSIENFSSFMNWLAFFFLSATVYGLQSFLNLPTSYLMMVMLAVTALIVYQIIWAYKIKLRDGLPYILISCLILAELAWSISFLPFNYNISGLGLAICYYVIIGLVKNHLLDKLDSKKVKIYLIVGSASLFILLFTAKWL